MSWIPIMTRRNQIIYIQDSSPFRFSILRSSGMPVPAMKVRVTATAI